jgi:hypothetical protein
VADAFTKAMEEGVTAAKLTGISGSAMQAFLKKNKDKYHFRVTSRSGSYYLVSW